MKTLLLSLSLVCFCAVNAQTPFSKTKTDKIPVLKSDYTLELNIAPTVLINTLFSNAKTGYIWGPLGFPSDSIVRMGQDFSTVIIKVDTLPVKVNNMALNTNKAGTIKMNKARMFYFKTTPNFIVES